VTGPGRLLSVADLAAAADPDLAARGLDRIVERDPSVAEQVADGDQLRRRLVAVLGASAALGEWLVRHPDAVGLLADPDLADRRPSRLGLQRQIAAAVDGLTGPPGLDALRRCHHRLLLALAARDLTADLRVDDVAGELADLADATLAGALQLAGNDRPGAADARLAVIGMGKCGGRELNYVSDVDVVFVAEPLADAGRATVLAMALMSNCSTVSAEGTIWPVDAALRPEGRSGPLVRTLESHDGYYRRWAATWEFQALLKARPAAGDTALGAAYAALAAEHVWTAANRPGFVEDVRAMRRRVVDTLPRQQVDRELKLGPGGLRDVEFAVQLLQLVHGRSDETLRSANTLEALEALAVGGYVGRDDALTLAAAYRFLRTVEHRLQLQQLRRTSLVPTDAAGLTWLARVCGFVDVEAWRRDYDRHTASVRRLHEKLFYRPLLAAVARLPTDEVRLTPDAAIARLTALGYGDPAAAMHHLEALTSGVSRRAAIQRTLLPAMLSWFADAGDPDAGLLAFRQVSDALGRTPWYLRLLRDEGVAAERLAHVLASSRYAADLLVRVPDAVALLADDDLVRPLATDALRREVAALLDRNPDSEQAVTAVRAVRRRELLRTACSDLLGLLDVDAVGRSLTSLTEIALDAALQTAQRTVAAAGGQPLLIRLAVIGMGRLGGEEQGYGSDADILFVYDAPADSPPMTQLAHDVANELRRLLAMPAPGLPLIVDADLRPEGRQGPLVRSLGSYEEYYRRWSQPWEWQALLRARPVAGDADLAAAFLAVIEPVRHRAGGLQAAELLELRRIKARVDTERVPRGVDATLHTKLGRGGLSDVEWTVQLLQLQHAARVAELRTTATLPALSAAEQAELIRPDDAQALRTAWLQATRVRNAIALVKGRGSDVLPTDPRTLSAVARILGYPAGHSGDLLEDYRRAARRARGVHQRLFFG
jgi:glutamate-ammonia-ligase adenylyltransferase